MAADRWSSNLLHRHLFFRFRPLRPGVQITARGRPVMKMPQWAARPDCTSARDHLAIAKAVVGVDSGAAAAAAASPTATVKCAAGAQQEHRERRRLAGADRARRPAAQDRAGWRRPAHQLVGRSTRQTCGRTERRTDAAREVGRRFAPRDGRNFPFNFRLSLPRTHLCARATRTASRSGGRSRLLVPAGCTLADGQKWPPPLLGARAGRADIAV